MISLQKMDGAPDPLDGRVTAKAMIAAPIKLSAITKLFIS
jgi:hypothetical protein